MGGGEHVSKAAAARFPDHFRCAFEEPNVWTSEIKREQTVARAFLDLDRVLESDCQNSSACGSTCCAALAWPTSGSRIRVLLANLGDSRGLVVRIGGKDAGRIL